MDRYRFSEFVDRFTQERKEDIVRDLVDLLKIPSVGTESQGDKPFGLEVDRALKYVQEKAESFGMVTKNVDGYAVHAEIGSGKEMAMALTHVDIVPAGSGWTRDPYGEVVDGKVYGRGSQDNKGPTIACLYALLALKESGAPLKRRVRHVSGGNEESGFRCVRHYFTVEELPTYGFSPDGYFPLVFAEKGSMNVSVKAELGLKTDAGAPLPMRLLELSGGERANIVCDSARAVLEVEKGSEIRLVRHLEKYVGAAREFTGGSNFLEFVFSAQDGKITVMAKGKAAHASTPDKGTNALTGLMFLLSKMEDSLDAAPALAFMANAAEINGKGLNIDSEDDVSGKLTCNLGIAKTEDAGGKRIVSTIYNIRYPVKVSGDELRQRALETDPPEGVTVEVLNVGKSHYSDPESFLVKTLLKVYREETGDHTSKPMAIGGGTYAKVIPGGVAFGPVKPGSPELAHQADEYITVEDLMEIVRIYAKALYDLAT